MFVPLLVSNPQTTNELTSWVFVGNTDHHNIPISIRLNWRWSYRQRSNVHDRTFRKTPDCVWGGHTILAPLFLLISLVLLLHGFPATVLVLPLVSQTFFAKIPFFIGGILVLRCDIIIVILVRTSNFMH